MANNSSSSIWMSAFHVSGTVAGTVVALTKPVAKISGLIHSIASPATSALLVLRTRTDSPYIPTAITVLTKVTRISKSVNTLAKNIGNSASIIQNAAASFRGPLPEVSQNLLAGIVELIPREDQDAMAVGFFRNFGVVGVACEEALTEMDLDGNNTTLQDLSGRLGELQDIIIAHFAAAAAEEEEN